MPRKTVISIGDRVSSRRRQLEMSQYELATKSGLRTEVISRLERGRSPASLVSVCKLAPVLGMTLDELVNGSEALASKGKKK
jgi:transcriptional regulator with XRE-family HTH domain